MKRILLWVLLALVFIAAPVALANMDIPCSDTDADAVAADDAPDASVAQLLVVAVPELDQPVQQAREEVQVFGAGCNFACRTNEYDKAKMYTRCETEFNRYTAASTGLDWPCKPSGQTHSTSERQCSWTWYGPTHQWIGA